MLMIGNGSVKYVCVKLRKGNNSMSEWKCGVLNCGNGKCIHEPTSEKCPLCGFKIIKVVTTGFKFCSNKFTVCDYEIAVARGTKW